MITNSGNYFQIFATIFSILAIITTLLANKKLTISCFYLSCLSTLLAFLLLVYGFIVSDFSLQNIFLNSSTLKPMGFKIAASWASHEGSILLWLCLLQIIGLIYIAFFNNRPSRIYQIIILSLIQILFGSFIYFTSNPFDQLSFTPDQGLGLNPMLQDIALIIHPPILYLGYVSYVIPFTIACTILLTSKIESTSLKEIKIFTNLGLLFLTLGIGLGSWWAYRELGWGGFWFFDPVENISLMPWLSAIVLHHAVLVTIKSRQMLNWTIILSIITFLLAIFATFLVRSGMLISIHAFASSETRALYLLGIFAAIAVSSIILMIIKSPKIPIILLANSNYIGTNYIILGNIFLLVALIMLLSATIYPVVYALFYEEIITISEKFFINNFIIFVIPILLLAAIAQKNNTGRKNLIKNLIIFCCALIITFISSYKIQYDAISLCIIISALFLIIDNCYLLLVKSEYLTGKLTVNIAMILGHFGFGLLVLTISLNSLLQSEVDFVGKIGDSLVSGEFEVTLRDIRFAQSENYYRQIAEFWIQDKQNNITILKPENRFYQIEQQLSQESNIYSYLFYDLYAVLSKIDGPIIHAKIYYRPMISFIWLSIIMIVGGFTIGLFTKRSINIL